MANVITAGNSSNGGTAITTDTSGTLNIVTGSGSGATAVTVDGSGNMVVTGTITASSGVSGGIRSGTAVTASGTSVDFTSLPTGLKRITVMFSGVSTSGTSNFLVQLGSGSVTATGYVGSVNTSNASANFAFSTGFMVLASTAAASLTYGQVTITNITSNTWVEASSLSTGVASSAGNQISAGQLALGGVLDRIRITTVNGTDTFDAGTINILFE